LKLSWAPTLAVDAADAVDAIEDCLWTFQVPRGSDFQSLGTCGGGKQHAMLNISIAAQRVT